MSSSSFPIPVPHYPVSTSSSNQQQQQLRQQDSSLSYFNHIPKEMSPPSSWQADFEAPQCPLCSKKFTLWVRRHHCR